MRAEVEAKFRAGPEALVSLAAVPALGEATLDAGRTVDEVDRYVDTADGRLAAAGWACRLRERDGATILSLKGPPLAEPVDAVHRRSELEGPAGPSLDPGQWPSGSARDHLNELRAGEPLIEVVRIEQRRVERAVLVGGRRIGTLSLDVVTVPRARDEEERLHIVELELDPDADVPAPQLDRLVGTLAAADGLVPDPRSKLEHAIEWLARS